MEFVALIFNTKIVQRMRLCAQTACQFLKNIALSYLKANPSKYALTYFQNKAFSTYVLLVISGIYLRIWYKKVQNYITLSRTDFLLNPYSEVRSCFHFINSKMPVSGPQDRLLCS